MQQALSYRTWLPDPPIAPKPEPSDPPSATTDELNPRDKNTSNLMMVKSLVMENAVVVFGRHGCCMSHVVKRLLLALGVNPAIYEVKSDKDEVLLIDELTKLTTAGDEGGGGGGGGDGGSNGNRLQLPLVYIGGKLFGGLDQVMSAHISGHLTPLLKKAGALWL